MYQAPLWAPRRGLLGLLALALSSTTPAPAPATGAGADGPSLEGLSSLLAEESALTAEADTVVTAARYAQRVDRTPSNVFVLTRQDIEALRPKSVADLLRFVPGFAVLRRQQHGQELSAFGVGGQFSNKILVLLDGHRVTEPSLGATLWAELPLVLEEIERVEVVLGPESTLHGTNAFAGVVNIITGPVGTEEGGRLTLRGGNRGFLEQSFVHRAPHEEGGLRLALQHERRGSFGALADGQRQIDAAFVSGEDHGRLVARLTHEAQPGAWRLRTSLAATRQDSEYLPTAPGSLAELDGRSRSLRLAFDLERAFSPTRSLDLRGSMQRLRRDLGAAPFLRLGIPSDSLDSSLSDFELTLRDRVGAWRLATGVLTRLVSATGYLLDPRDDDAETTELYLHGERNLGDRFVLFLGSRWIMQDLADDEVSWKVAGLYRPRPDTAFRLSLGTSFRQPDLITARFVTASSFLGAPLSAPLFTNTPNLQSEVAHEFVQAGVERRWRRGRAKLDFYTARLENLIGFVDSGPPVVAFTPAPLPLGLVPQQWQNSMAHARVRGYTLALEQELGELQLRLGANLQEVDGLPGSTDSPYAPPRSGSLALLRPPAEGRRTSWSLAWTGVSRTDVDRNAILDGAAPQLPGYGTVDVQVTRKVSPRGSVTLALRNMFDQQHREMIYSLLGDTREQGVWFGREYWLAFRWDM